MSKKQRKVETFFGDFLSNFKVIVLRAQTELCAQIWGSKRYTINVFEKIKILRGFPHFGLFS